ncbi:mitochondrial import receptor protein [Mortierella sp. AD011]|nr:mitochondrial import receptor protein [Mortierella sp. AD010]KAF9404058.1 mitochondrial import receptor protein [Mortierella sp. AD011]
MVKLEEVSLDHVEEEEYTDTDSSSVYSSDEDEDDVDNIESIMDRILALQDVIPAKTRKSISDKCSSIYGWGKYGVKFLGNSAWVLTTSALLLVLPLMIELEHEQGLIEYEKMQQQSSQASCSFLASNSRMLSQAPSGQQQQKKPASGIVPPGF